MLLHVEDVTMAYRESAVLWDIDLDVPEHVAVENVHLSDSLHTLSFMIRSNELEESDK